MTEAEPVLRRYLDGKPSPEIRMAYARLLLEWQRYTEARQQLGYVTSEKPDLPQAWMAQAALQFQDNDLNDAEASLEKYAALVDPHRNAATGRAGMTPAYLLHAQIAEKRGDYAAAEQWLARIENEQDFFSVQTRRASLLARQGKLAEARALIRSIPADNDEARSMNLKAEVQLLRDARQYREAYSLQKSLVDQSPTDDDLAYELAMLADKIGEHRTMERLLRQIMVRNPSYHHAYNALGYSLAERGVRLAEAKELILKALSFAPKDPFITDSLAWVEFRQGNSAEALRLLETAFGIRPDADIAAHLGEVLWTQGNQERAKAIWRESLRLNPDNETLRETLQRLNIKL
jgi:tetratricopeptide (TPR) repeat protein